MTVDAFHAHLDACQRCENQPFDLCPIGQGLLKQAAVGLPRAPPPSKDTTQDFLRAFQGSFKEFGELLELFARWGRLTPQQRSWAVGMLRSVNSHHLERRPNAAEWQEAYDTAADVLERLGRDR